MGPGDEAWIQPFEGLHPPLPPESKEMPLLSHWIVGVRC